MIQRIFHLKSERQRTLRLLFGDCRHNYFHSLTKLAFPLSKGQLCLYDKQNNTWLLTDMEFLFSCSTRREIPYLRAPMYYSLFTCHRTNAVSELKSEPQFFKLYFALPYMSICQSWMVLLIFVACKTIFTLWDNMNIPVNKKKKEGLETGSMSWNHAINALSWMWIENWLLFHC